MSKLVHERGMHAMKTKFLSLALPLLLARSPAAAQAARIRRQNEADASLYETQKEADARKAAAEAARYAAEQEAEGIRAKGEAEAQAIQAKALAEAQGIEKKAQAQKTPLRQQKTQCLRHQGNERPHHGQQIPGSPERGTGREIQLKTKHKRGSLWVGS